MRSKSLPQSNTDAEFFAEVRVENACAALCGELVERGLGHVAIECRHIAGVSGGKPEVHPRLGGVVIRHGRALLERVQITEDKVPHIAHALAAEIAPEKWIALNVAAKFLAALHEQIRQSSPACESRRAPVDSLAIAGVICQCDGIVAEAFFEAIHAAQRERAVCGMPSGIVHRDLEALFLQCEIQREVVCVRARRSRNLWRVGACDGPHGFRGAHPALGQEAVDGAIVFHRAALGVVKNGEGKVLAIRPLDSWDGGQIRIAI